MTPAARLAAALAAHPGRRAATSNDTLAVALRLLEMHPDADRVVPGCDDCVCLYWFHGHGHYSVVADGREVTRAWVPRQGASIVAGHGSIDAYCRAVLP